MGSFDSPRLGGRAETLCYTHDACKLVQVSFGCLNLDLALMRPTTRAAYLADFATFVPLLERQGAVAVARIRAESEANLERIRAESEANLERIRAETEAHNARSRAETDAAGLKTAAKVNETEALTRREALSCSPACSNKAFKAFPFASDCA